MVSSRIAKVLQRDFKINRISIVNFTTLNKSVDVEVEIILTNLENRKIIFYNVSGINIMAEDYSCSEKPTIVVEDISSAQLENKTYKVSIVDEVMSFYCKTIDM